LIKTIGANFYKMSITKKLDRIAFDVFEQTKTTMYDTIAKELEYSDLEDINDNELHEYVMNQVINRFIQK